MADATHHVVPVSPSLRVQALDAGGQARAALLLAIRWSEATDAVDALVVSEHGGIAWIAHDRIEAVRLD